MTTLCRTIHQIVPCDVAILQFFPRNNRALHWTNAYTPADDADAFATGELLGAKQFPREPFERTATAP